MSSWNYRVLKKFDEFNPNGLFNPNGFFKIIEVYYNDDNTIMGWVDLSRPLEWEDYEDLKNTLVLMEKAFNRPTMIVMDDNFNLGEIQTSGEIIKVTNFKDIEKDDNNT